MVEVWGFSKARHSRSLEVLCGGRGASIASFASVSSARRSWFSFFLSRYSFTNTGQEREEDEISQCIYHLNPVSAVKNTQWLMVRHKQKQNSSSWFFRHTRKFGPFLQPTRKFTPKKGQNLDIGEILLYIKLMKHKEGSTNII